jgi:hypothetical protein
MGCGKHVEAALADIPAADRCVCPRAVTVAGDVSSQLCVKCGTQVSADTTQLPTIMKAHDDAVHPEFTL